MINIGEIVNEYDKIVGPSETVKRDIFDVLETCPHEVTGLLKKIEAGEIDGRVYIGDCCCLLGTLAELKIGSAVEAADWNKTICSNTRMINAFSPAELWFTNIQIGDTPDTNYHAKIASLWIQEWLESKGMLK